MRIRLGLALAVIAAPAIARAATITVSNTNDSGTGSLRQAILTANATGAADTIRFAIPGSGVHKILPTTALPEITSPVPMTIRAKALATKAGRRRTALSVT